MKWVPRGLNKKLKMKRILIGGLVTELQTFCLQIAPNR